MKTTLGFLAMLAVLIGVALFGSKQVGAYALTGAVLGIALWFVIRVLRD